MQKILWATDFSDNAWNAIFTTVKLYADVECSFYILHAYEPGALHMLGKKNQLRLGTLYDSLAQYSQQELERIMEYFDKNNTNPKHRFKTISKSETLEEAVREIVSAEDIDLIVMGNRGATGAKEIFLGSNTIQVANTITTCPLLAVPKDIDYKIPKEIAFITDLKKGCTAKTIAPVLLLASLTRASIRVMHINEGNILYEEQESNKKLLEHCLKEVDHSFHWIRHIDDKARLIDDFLRELDIDMFAMVHQKRSFIQKLFREPIIEEVSVYANIPFLILPSQD